ncbi:alpha/beta hydrolase [Hyphomonas atlantica corrig.]|uniref:alpha/beta hydrolase n=1 Tax=Hyphomonas atlantica TaxID=1280948 RepID=UPI0023560660|nr:alpha/beta hydrolase [Hyphomonas atlantica]|tara:strand:- start:496 stop:1491 length:996 start_codon:yes stop_codon:yes gene_type:complete
MKLKQISLLSVFLTMGFFSGCKSVPVPKAELAEESAKIPALDIIPSETFLDVEYLQTPQRPLHLDIYLHPNVHTRPTPIILYFHGGGWARGAPPDSWTGFRHFLSAGYSIATVEYRLSGEAKAPAAVQDARCALKWIGTNSDRLGIDRERIVLFGTSAGGHLALMTGLLAETNDIDIPECEQPPQAAAILDYYGPSDLTKFTSKNGKRHPTIVAFTGAGDEGKRVEELISPINHVSSESSPVFIVHGTDDPTVPIEQSYDLKKSLDEMGVPSTLHVVPQGRHGKFNDTEQLKIQAEVLAFLSDHGIDDNSDAFNETRSSSPTPNLEDLENQ